MNHHFRYILPAFPFLFIWISKVAWLLERRPRAAVGIDDVTQAVVSSRTRHNSILRKWLSGYMNWIRSRQQPLLASAVIIALAWSIVSSLSVYPHSLSYFNELAVALPSADDESNAHPVGRNDTSYSFLSAIKAAITAGPRNGPRHLLDSNIDWGQDLLFLKAWLDEHSNVKLDGLAYYGAYPSVLAGVPETPLPAPRLSHVKSCAKQRGPRPGWYALSVNYIYRQDGQYRYFLNFEPVAMAGYSIYIYHITLDEANRVRKQLGLVELASGEQFLNQENKHPAGAAT